MASERGILVSNSSPIGELTLRKIGTNLAEMDKRARTEAVSKLRKIMDNEIELLLKDNEMLMPPFDPRKIGKIGSARIDIKTASRSLVGADGSLKPTHTGFLLSIDQDLTKEAKYARRLRSTMVHELMHTFFYNTNSLPPTKFGGGTTTSKDFLMEEELCCYLTREFLMPKFVMFDSARDYSKKNPSLKNIEALKSVFKVSSDIVAYRMIIDLSLWDAIFLKTMKEGNLFKSITRLKSKSNPLYRSLKAPKYIPEIDSHGEWEVKLAEHIKNALKSAEFLELITVEGHKIALESRIETRTPLCIETIAYEVS